jgi:hypothetical protein
MIDEACMQTLGGGHGSCRQLYARRTPSGCGSEAWSALAAWEKALFLNPHFVEQCPRIFWIICFQYLAETSAASLLEQSRLSLDRTPQADCPLMRTGQCTFPNRALLETTRPFPQCPKWSQEVQRSTSEIGVWMAIFCAGTNTGTACE